MLKFWLRSKSKQLEPETDSYSQLLTHRDPYFESLVSTVLGKEQEKRLELNETDEVGKVKLGS